VGIFGVRFIPALIQHSSSIHPARLPVYVLQHPDGQVISNCRRLREAANCRRIQILDQRVFQSIYFDDETSS
jgi:hypothetical protein